MKKMAIETIGYTEETTMNGQEMTVRYVGKMSKSAFVRTILKGETYGVAWVKIRIGVTSNDYDLSLIDQYPGKVVVFNANTNEIIEIREQYK